MKNKKVLYKKNGMLKNGTVESYACGGSNCIKNCNPCGSVPSTDYLDVKYTIYENEYVTSTYR